MQKINIKINISNLSSNIRNKSLNWSLQFLKKKIKSSDYINKQYSKKLKKIECILIDKYSLFFNPNG